MTYDEILYEGYGPGGVAFLVECLTDNKNRAAADVRHIFTKRGGSLAKAGAVAYLFEAKGIITFDKEKVDEDTLMEAALEAGADDVVDEGDVWEVHCSPSDFNAINEALGAAGLEPLEAEVTKQSSTTVDITDKGRRGQGAGAHGGPGRGRRRAKRLLQLRHRRKDPGRAGRRVGMPQAPAPAVLGLDPGSRCTGYAVVTPGAGGRIGLRRAGGHHRPQGGPGARAAGLYFLRVG